jgi:L-cysteate sulfo-lyase
VLDKDGCADRVPLGSWPTPLESAPRLGAALGLQPGDLWIKRDDLTGLGAGGNKVRKLEYTCAAAIARKATTLITIGAAQSNHARLTAAAGASLGLEVILVLAGTPDGPIGGNLALDALFGATIQWAGDVDDTELEAQANKLAGQLGDRGVIAEVIPFGGSSVAGARGYVECGRELLKQAPALAQVVVAVGSGGTMAGLVHALTAQRVIGVHTGAVSDPHDRVQRIVDGLGIGCEATGPGMPLRLRLDQVGIGYGHLSDSVRAALRVAARTEGLILDPIYTGRAMAGLAAAVTDGTIRPGQRTVFLHSGGLPGLFGHPDAMAFAAGELTSTT